MSDRAFALSTSLTGGALAIVERGPNGPWIQRNWEWTYSVPFDEPHTRQWRKQLMRQAVMAWEAAGLPDQIIVHTAGGRHGRILAHFFEAVCTDFTWTLICTAHGDDYGLSAVPDSPLDQAIALACDWLGYLPERQAHKIGRG